MNCVEPSNAFQHAWYVIKKKPRVIRILKTRFFSILLQNIKAVKVNVKSDAAGGANVRAVSFSSHFN